MTDTVSARQTEDIDLVLQDLERFGTFGDIEPDAPLAVEQFCAALNPGVTARALSTQSLARGGPETIQAIAGRISMAPDAMGIAVDLVRKTELNPLSVFLVASIFRTLGSASPLAEVQVVPGSVMTVHDALREDGYVHFIHDGALSRTALLIVDLADPVGNCSRTTAEVSATYARFPASDAPWLEHARVACPAFVIIATA